MMECYVRIFLFLARTDFGPKLAPGPTEDISWSPAGRNAALKIIIGMRLVCKERPSAGSRNKGENSPMLPASTTLSARDDLQRDGLATIATNHSRPHQPMREICAKGLVWSMC